MAVRSANFDYSTTKGILLPGFMETPDLLGTNLSSSLPGLPFAFGSSADIRDKAVARGMMSTDSLQNNPYMEKYSKTINAGAVVEPFTEFRIQLSAGLTRVENQTEFFKYDHAEQQFKHFSPQFGGNYSITTIAWKTAFTKEGANRSSPVFETFLDYR